MCEWCYVGARRDAVASVGREQFLFAMLVRRYIRVAEQQGLPRLKGQDYLQCSSALHARIKARYLADETIIPDSPAPRMTSALRVAAIIALEENGRF